MSEGNIPLNANADDKPPTPPAKKLAKVALTLIFLSVFGLFLLLEPELTYADHKDCHQLVVSHMTADSHQLVVSHMTADSHIGCHLPKLFGGVLLINVVTSTLIIVFVLSFGYAGAARGKFGFPLPTMYAATDIYTLDVESGGKLLGGGEVTAQERLKRATIYNCHQRAHQQPLETYQCFLALSLMGGLQYPALTVTKFSHIALSVVRRPRSLSHLNSPLLP